MPNPLDALTALLPQNGASNVSAPMPGPLAQPSPQLAMMPNLPTQATPMRTADPSGRNPMHIPWQELLQTLAPVMGSLASGDSKGGFMHGFTQGQQIVQEQQDKKKQEAEQKRQQAEQFRLHIFDQARQITDPQEWAQFVNLATESAMHMGLISDPSEMKQFLTYPQHLNDARSQKELLDKLGEVMKRPDFQSLMDHGATVTLKDGTRMKLHDAVTIAGALPEVNGQPVAPPTDKTTAPSDYEQSFARYLKGIRKTPDTATSADEMAFKKLDRTAAADPAMGDLNKTLKELQIATERDRLSKSKAAGLSPMVERQVVNLGKGFDSLPVVKNAQVAAEAVQFANKLDTNTKNPADDQGLIYAFAKAMDPNSVVREGEYATVQKYAQSWAQSFGFNAARIFSNVAFLTPEARANMKTTIQAKFEASRGQYENIRKSYASKINKITGSQDGESYLSDYAGAFPDGPAQTGQPTGGPTKTQKVGRFEVSY